MPRSGTGCGVSKSSARKSMTSVAPPRKTVEPRRPPARRQTRRSIADAEKSGGPTTAAMEEWKKDVENRVKIIQKKAMDLLDREEKLRKKEEELRALASQLGAKP